MTDSSSFPPSGVANYDTGFRDEFADEFGERIDGLHAIVNEIDLASRCNSVSIALRMSSSLKDATVV